jgi:hypothetical protein
MKTVLAEKAREEQAEVVAKSTVRIAVEANSVAHEEQAKVRLADEVAVGREAHDLSDARAQKDFMRAYISSPSGKLAIKRLKLDVATISDADVLNHADLSFAFYHFVFLRSRSKAARTRA